ncbi:MAG: hypothetical protein JNJ88_13765 [Planctomycetes bacterium]|nr:hypothetical protein [Planctomycetota bacterium]
MRSILTSAFVVSLVAFSGFCSLVYQVVWDRSVRTNFGGDNVSSAIVTGTFLLGLGLGAVLFGRTWRRPFHVYSAVEAAIGIYAIISHFVLGSLARILARVASTSIESVESLRVPLVGACILFLLPPCILMGGTLPLMFRCFVNQGTYRSKTLGWLYGFNTLGAAAGTVAAPIYLLSQFTVPATLQILGAGNLVLAACIFLCSKFMPSEQNGEEDAASAPASVNAAKDAVGQAPGSVESGSAAPSLSLQSVRIIAFLTGFVSLAYEVALLRHVFVMNPNSPYNFPLVLAPFLVAIALGSAVFTRLRNEQPRSILLRISILSVLSAAAVIVPPAMAADYLECDPVFVNPEHITTDIRYVASLAMPLPLFLSGIFPLLVRLAASRLEMLPKQTGSVYIANSAGAFLGALLAQFLGFRLLGMGGVLLSLAAICLLVSVWAVGAVHRRAQLAVGAAAALSLGAVIFLPRARLENKFTYGRPYITHRDQAGRRFPDEWLDLLQGTTGVSTLRWGPGGRLAEVYVNGMYMSALPDHPDHVALAGFVLSFPRPESILVLGLGGGGMVREILKDPRVKRVEVVDWSHELPAILELPRPKAVLENCLKDPRVRIWRADARVAVGLYPPDSFDVVLDNLTIPEWTGSTAIRSVEYFSEVRTLLKKNGMYISNNHGYDDSRMSIRKSLLMTFANLWAHPRSILVASDGDPGFTAELSQAAFAPRAAQLQLTGPSLSFYVMEALKPVQRDELTEFEPIRDDLLVHEYRHRSLAAFWADWRRR